MEKNDKQTKKNIKTKTPTRFGIQQGYKHNGKQKTKCSKRNFLSKINKNN